MSIEFVQQPTDNSCLSACLAMITGNNIHNIIEDFHLKYHEHKTTPYNYLDEQSIVYSMPCLKFPKKKIFYIQVIHIY